MPRQKVSRRTSSISYDSLETIIWTANELIKNHPDLTYSSIIVDYETDRYGDSERYAVLQYQVDESDKEMAEREAREAKWKADQAERDRATYEKLKKQFEK